MGRRILRISTDLVVDILKGLTDGPPRYFQVVKDAIPADVKVVEVVNSNALYAPGFVEVTLESETWDEALSGTLISPVVQTVGTLGGRP